jgi:hypothetical protein
MTPVVEPIVLAEMNQFNTKANCLSRSFRLTCEYTLPSLWQQS